MFNFLKWFLIKQKHITLTLGNKTTSSTDASNYNAPPATLVMPTDCLCLSPWHGKHWSTVDHQVPECVNFTFWQSKHSHTLPSIYQNYFDIWNWIRNDVAPRSLHLTAFWAHKGSCLNYFNIQITCTTCLEPYHPTFRARKHAWILSLDIQVRFTNFECNGLDDKSRYGISSQHSNADLIHIGTTKDFNYKSNVTMQNYCVNSLLRRPMCNND